MEAGAEYGTVTKVVVYDREPAGIVSVRFSEDADAEKFAKKANGMAFGERDGVQQYLAAWIAQDRPKYKKSGKGTESDEEEESARLEAFVNADTS
jgi:HIV Tat-specific factor 1